MCSHQRVPELLKLSLFVDYPCVTMGLEADLLESMLR